MDFRAYKSGDSQSIEDLFLSVFTESEGQEEGMLIGKLVRELIVDTDAGDIYGFVAVEGEEIIGAIFFSRLTCEADIDVFILSPVAIHAEEQGKGLGQALINYALQEMRKSGVSIVTTYGDPSFYSKVGFEPISQDVLAAPMELSQPEGWLGQSLTSDAIKSIPGPSRCVKALDNPAYW